MSYKEVNDMPILEKLSKLDKLNFGELDNALKEFRNIKLYGYVINGRAYVLFKYEIGGE